LRLRFLLYEPKDQVFEEACFTSYGVQQCEMNQLHKRQGTLKNAWKHKLNNFFTVCRYNDYWLQQQQIIVALSFGKWIYVCFNLVCFHAKTVWFSWNHFCET